MTEPLAIPEWVATLVGRLMLENQMYRLQLAALEPKPEPPPE